MTLEWLDRTWAEAMRRLHSDEHTGVLLFADNLSGQDVRPCAGVVGRRVKAKAAEYGETSVQHICT